MFYVGFTSAARVDSEGWAHALGELLLGRDSERFQSDLRYWSMARYEAQWRAAVARLAQSPSAMLVTSYRGFEADFHLTWSIWREGHTAYFQEQLLLTALLRSPFDPDAAHEHVGPRQTVTEDGEPISEWQLPLGDVLAFLLE